MSHVGNTAQDKQHAYVDSVHWDAQQAQPAADIAPYIRPEAADAICNDKQQKLVLRLSVLPIPPCATGMFSHCPGPLAAGTAHPQ
jgi:hypothetical protein